MIMGVLMAATAGAQVEQQAAGSRSYTTLKSETLQEVLDQNQERLNSIESNISTLESGVSTLGSGSTSLDSTTASHAGRLDALEGDVPNIQDSLATVTATATGHGTRLDALEGDVPNIQDSLATVTDAADALDTRVSTLETTVVTGSNAASAVGRVNSDGTVVSADNLTCTRTATGNYTISFTTPLANADYAIFIHPIGTSNDTNPHINAASIATTGFSFWLGDADNGNGGDVPVNRAFSVMVVSW